MYILRSTESRLRHFASGYPLVVVTGPRQSGKSMRVRHAFPEHNYVSLEDLDQRDFADNDPPGFLARFTKDAILDEVQCCPALFSYLQTQVDERQRPGEFILTGSQQFGLLSGVTQSLAGRAALMALLPLTYSEFACLFLETVIVTCVITYGVEIEQRDIRWENFIQEEVILTDALQG